MDQINDMSEFATMTWSEQPLHFMNRIKSVIGPGGTFKYDVKIKCEDGTIKCHKILLAMSSPYFAKMFKKSKLGQKQKVMLPIVSKRTFGYLYEFICNGSVTLPLDQKDLLIQAGQILVVEGFKGMTMTKSVPLQKELLGRNEVIDIGIQTDPELIQVEDSSTSEHVQKEPDGNDCIIDLEADKKESCAKPTPEKNPKPSSSEGKLAPERERRSVTFVDQNELAAAEKSKAEELASIINDSSDDSDFQGPQHTVSKIESADSKPGSSKIANRLKLRPMSKQLASKQMSKRKRKSDLDEKGDKTSGQTKKKTRKQGKQSVETIICEFKDCDFTTTTEEEMTTHSEGHSERYYCSLCQQVFMFEENRDVHSKECSIAN